MKPQLFIILLTVLPQTFLAHSQGTVDFVYDQQVSAVDVMPVVGLGAVMQNVPSPWGQSFTPGLSSVGFIRLALDDGNVNDGLGVTLSVNLRANSINGTLLSSTDPVMLPNGFAGVANFIFSTPVSVTSGVTYYFEPVVQSGGLWQMLGGEDTYPDGTSFVGGNPLPGSDFWFREGIVVPEPSTVALVVLGLGVFCFTRRRG